MAADIACRSFRNYEALKALKNLGVGLGGAVAGFALEQSVNVYEDDLQTESREKTEDVNKIDEQNNIGVIATEN